MHKKSIRIASCQCRKYFVQSRVLDGNDVEIASCINLVQTGGEGSMEPSGQFTGRFFRAAEYLPDAAVVLRQGLYIVALLYLFLHHSIYMLLNKCKVLIYFLIAYIFLQFEMFLHPISMVLFYNNDHRMMQI